MWSCQMASIDRQKTILLVEDQAIIALAEAAKLRAAGYNVVTVMSGEQAIETVRDNSDIDLVLMDIDLGAGIDGTVAAEHILKFREVPIVFHSAYTDPSVVAKTEGVTSYGYIVKSSGATVLLASVKMAFRLHEAKIRERENEEKYHFLFETMTQGVLYQSPDGAVLDANPAAERILGLSLEQLQSQRCSPAAWKAIHEDGTEVTTESSPVELALQTGRPVHGTVLGLLDHGVQRYRWIRVDSTPIFRPGEASPFQVCSTFEDITERKLSEDKVRESEAELNQIFEAIPIGLWFADETGTLKRANSAGKAIWGGEPLVGPQGYQVFKASRCSDGKAIEPEEWALNRTIRDGVAVTGELIEIEGFDGQKRIVVNSTIPVKNTDGRLKGGLVINEDVTAQKRGEDLVRRMSELQALLIELATRHINLPLDEIEPAVTASLQKIGQFIGADRTYIFEYDFSSRTCVQTHEWCAEGIEPQLAALEPIPLDDIPDWVDTHCRGESIQIPCVDSLPHGQVREILQPQGVKSLATFPMTYKSTCTGFVGFDLVRSHHEFQEEEMHLLSIFAEMLTSIQLRQKTEEAVRVLHKSLLSILDGISASICVVDMSTYEIIFANEYCRQTLGDVEGNLCWRALQSNQDGPCSFCSNSRLVDAHGEPTGAHRWEHFNTKVGRWYECRDVAVRWVDGRLVRLELSTDITDRKNSESELRSMERKYQQLFDAVPMPIWQNDFSAVQRWLDEVGNSSEADLRAHLRGNPDVVRELAQKVQIVDANPAALELYQAESKGAFLASVTQLFTERSYEVFLEELVLIATGSRRFRIEQTHVTRAGKEIDLELHWSVAPGCELDCSTVYVSAVDITERKRLETDLRAKEQWWRRALEGAGQGAWGWDISTNQLMYSMQIQELYGCKEWETSRTLESWLSRVHPEDVEQVLQDVHAHLRGESEIFESQHRIMGRGGDYRWILCRGRVVMRSEDGEPVHAAGTKTEISKLNQAERRIETLLREKDLLLKESHHRVKNNMAVIRSLLSLESARRADSQCGRVLEEAAMRIQSMMTLYDRLYRSAGDAAVSLHEYLDSLIRDILQPIDIRTNVAVDIEIDPDIELSAKVLSSLGIIVNELVSNSLKHAFINSGEDNRITVKGYTGGDALTLIYADNGVGLPEAFSLDESQGFGSTLILALAEQIGASVSVKSNGGTEYNLKLAV